MKQSELERGFERLLSWNKISGYERNYRYVPGRRFELDFAWPAVIVGVEIQGGIFQRGPSGHKGIGHVRDMLKMNLAQIAGWRILQFDASLLRRDPQGCIEQLRALLDQATGIKAGEGSR